MPPTGRMRHLTTVQGSFHGRVVAARLGSEGILVELRGMSDGPYPLQGAVDIFVSEEQLSLSREILLADAVDAAVDDVLVEAEFAAGGAGTAGTAVTPDDGFRTPGGDYSGPLSVDPVDPEAMPSSESSRHPTWLRAALALVVVVALVVVGVVAVTG